jgi:hypothetical protein
LYKLFILNSLGAKIAHVKNLVPIKGTTCLEFEDYLSNYGSLKFRIQTKDPLLATTNIVEPHKYLIRLERDNATVFEGPIVNNPKRNHQFIEVEAKTYAWYLTKVQVNHTATTPDFRQFNAGTMATAVDTLFDEGVALANSPIHDFTVGTITNPDYPWAKETAWTFTTNLFMEFQHQDLFSVISSMANASNADFTVSDDKVFDFKPSIGTTRNDVTITFGRGGNCDDYDSPLDGEGMFNEIVCASFNSTGGSIIRSNVMSDTSLYTDYHRLWAGFMFDESLSPDTLNERAKRLLLLNKIANAQVDLVLNEKAMPMGTYNLGDYIRVNINDGPISFNKERRIIGWKVSVMSNGVERTTLVTSERFD